MTREAKVGLLLGLVFIVAIAMVLRGIHQSGQSEMLESGVAESYADRPSENPLSDVVNLSVAVDKLSDPGEAAPEPAVIPTSAAGVESQPRYVQVLPSTTVSSPAGSVEQPTVTMVTAPAAELPEAEATVQEAAPMTTAFVPPSGAVERALEQITTPVSSASMLQGAGAVVNPKSGKVYDVKQGDSLTAIALKMYGPQEGKKKSNIDRIYEANKQAMKSSDDLWIGQKLMIPELPKSAVVAQATTSKPAETSKATEKASKASTSARTYVVKDGDSLWKIAQKELGNGSRYTEIVNLNSKALKKGKDISVGMKLTLPAK